jgi:anaphase-promoting complex subunit 10
MEASISEALDTTGQRELGAESVWSLSTAKPGNGVEQIRDDNLETYWQSDGSQPHLINIQFMRKMAVSKLCFYLDYNLDESYTPKRIGVKCGTSLHDLVDVTAVELHEPVGWVSVPLAESSNASSSMALRTHFLQIRIMQMHQNGRDTHIRQVKIYGPRLSPMLVGNISMESFKTVEMQQHAMIR